MCTWQPFLLSFFFQDCSGNQHERDQQPLPRRLQHHLHAEETRHGFGEHLRKGSDNNSPSQTNKSISRILLFFLSRHRSGDATRQNGVDHLLWPEKCVEWMRLLPVIPSVLPGVIRLLRRMFDLLHHHRSARSAWWTWLAAREPTQPEPKEPDLRSEEVTLVFNSMPTVRRNISNGKETSMTSLTDLQEGANINKSLTTLGKVISALAEQVCFFPLRVIIYFHFMLSN